MNAHSGLFFLIVGPGGAGKDTLMNAAFAQAERDGLPLRRLVTATSRPPREKETDGTDYHFKTRSAFEAMIANDELIEYVQVTSGNYYGVPRALVDSVLSAGEHLMGDVDVIGAKTIREHYPQQAVVIFITVKGETIQDKLAVLRARMEGRNVGSDAQAIVEERLTRAETLELPFEAQADYVIVNDDLQRAQQAFYDVITACIAREARHEPK